ncbi:PmoA family protein [Microbacterium sp.]|uniref:DUF6807 domain-containing protein n=1 Tax=Microbacterium sp. TaxID=51671 RepID=UPI003F730EB9
MTTPTFERTHDRVVVRDGDTVLLDYVFAPTDAAVESPRPYALLRTRTGADVTAYRPADHVWHKGLSLALPNVGPHNFWGGPTFVAGEGYMQLPNNGAQVHRSFAPSPGIDERLEWIAERGELVLTERRTVGVRIVDDATWALTWCSSLRNASGAALALGSPTTKGRPDAGYAGIFWRGASSFTDCAIEGPSGRVDDTARGRRSPWLAAVAGDVGVLMAGDPEAPWFARSADYAGLASAPFFFEETVLAPNETILLSAAVIVGDREVARHALLAERLRAAASIDPDEESS